MELANEQLVQNAAIANFTCDNPAALTNFNGAKYMGTWYEQSHIKGQFFEPDDATCVEAIYSNLKSDGHFVVNNTEQDAKFGPRTGITGTGYCPDATGRCYVKFGPQLEEANVRPNYNVIDTDYTSYAVVYACGALHNFLWLLSREPVISDTLYNKMYASAKAKLPHFDFTTLAPREYQGSKCSYVKSNDLLD
jgi:lipocalin